MMIFPVKTGDVAKENSNLKTEEMISLKNNDPRLQAKLEWISIYKEGFDCQPDLSEVVIPSYYDPDEHFAIIVAKGMTIDRAIAALRKKFPIESLAGNFDSSVTRNDRIADRSYCVLVKRNIEADAGLRTISAKVLSGMENFKGITLLERVLLEGYYFSQTGSHLDMKNTTLCCGSSDPRGFTPSVRFDRMRGAVSIVWYRSKFKEGYLRPRRVYLAA